MERRGDRLWGKASPTSLVGQVLTARPTLVWVGTRERRKRRSSRPAGSEEDLGTQENF